MSRSTPYLSAKTTQTFENAFAVLIVAAATGAFYRSGLATYVWALIYVLSILVIMQTPLRWLDAMALSWPLLLFPLFCVMSVFWSVDVTATARNSLQYLFTLFIAVLLGTRMQTERLVGCISFATLGCILVSVVGTKFGWVDGFQQHDYPGAERYFVGLYTQKNVLGTVAVIAAITTIGMGLIAKRGLLSFFVAGLLLIVVLQARSATSLLLCGAAFSAYLIWWALQSGVRTNAILLSSGVLVTGTFLVLGMIQLPVVDLVLEALGKERTLTGRTIIWDSGLAVAMEQPFQGVGYQAFWSADQYRGMVDGIRAAVLDSIAGFHSAYLEVFVGLGLLGLLFYVVMLLSSLNRCVAAFRDNGKAVGFVACAVTVIVIARTFSESTAYYQHDLEFMLLVSLPISLRFGPGNLVCANKNVHQVTDELLEC